MATIGLLHNLHYMTVPCDMESSVPDGEPADEQLEAATLAAAAVSVGAVGTAICPGRRLM